MKSLKIFFLAVTAFFLYSSFSHEGNWIDKKLSELTLREQIAQMIITYSDGFKINESSAEYQRLENAIRNEKVGGVIFFKGNSVQENELINKLQSISETPLLISADFERGTAMRLDDGSLFPNNMAIGATGKPEFAYRMALQIAKECRAIGIHQNYAPVLDVNSNPDNPIINVRSFGENPELVSEFGKMVVTGLQDGNVIATGKHFPGHGDTDIDSHNDLPVINKSFESIRLTELPPFKTAIQHGVMSIMIAHVAFPELEGNLNLPASLSQNAVTKLLKEELGFKGLVVTDALNMAGITKHYSTEEVALLCVEAGIDLILMPQGEKQTIDAIENAVKSGKIRPDRIESSARKILEVKQWLMLNENKYSAPDKLNEIINSKETQQLALEIAEASITLVKDDLFTLPFKKSDSPKNCLMINLINTGDTKSSRIFETAFNENSGGVFSNISVFDITSEKFDKTEILKYSADADVIIIPIYSKVKIKTGTVGIPNQQVELIKELISAGRNVTVISLGNPYLIRGFSETPAYICSYGDAPCSVNAVVNTIFGKVKFRGKLPVTISNDYKSGHGIEK